MASEPPITRIRADTIAEVLRQLEFAKRRIAQRLAGVTDLQNRQRLEALLADIRRNLEAFREAASNAASSGAAQAIRVGIAEVTGPLAAQGIGITPTINPLALTSMRVALTDMVTDISRSAMNRINGQLTQVLIGAQPLSDAVTAVQKIIDGPTRSRARTIVYTELGRINSAATQLSLEDAAKKLPGLKKRWVASGKKYPRDEHVAADGQLVDVDEPFVVDGEELMYPRDPKGSAKNTINCGCRHIPVVEGSRWGEELPKPATLDLASPNALGLNITRDPDAE